MRPSFKACVQLWQSCEVQVLDGQEEPELISRSRVALGIWLLGPRGLSGKEGSLNFPAVEARNSLPPSLSDKAGLFSKPGWLNRCFAGLRGSARN